MDDGERLIIPIMFYAICANGMLISIPANINVPTDELAQHVFADTRLQYIILSVDKLPFMTYYSIVPNRDGA